MIKEETELSKTFAKFIDDDLKELLAGLGFLVAVLAGFLFIGMVIIFVHIENMAKIEAKNIAPISSTSIEKE